MAAMARGNLDVLQFGRIGQGEVEVTRWFIAAPRSRGSALTIVLVMGSATPPRRLKDQRTR
jgi:hypothetical protein